MHPNADNCRNYAQEPAWAGGLNLPKGKGKVEHVEIEAVTHKSHATIGEEDAPTNWLTAPVQ